MKRFEQFLQKLFVPERIKLHIYTTGKRSHPGYKLYVNCRPLLRIFKGFKESRQRNITDDQNIRAYFAGRFDGDGCIDKYLKKDCRISYGNKLDAVLDINLLQKLGFEMTRLYWYKTSSTHVLYVSRFETEKFSNLLNQYSLKLQKFALGPRRDLDRQRAIQTTNITLS
ncbi:hypothetical protein A3B18_04125 [Candidatus Giovannonibacteria bacterium RIFCSPLOWO2_01_FULL_46_13]|uniref:Uncharacterized protein n=1 Tax=Candidatus Giovannonibacteria bacterium RIFCSPLOWO2_01_FULL_46_13 TaxID=1798352 RepID=A0A1F5X2T6_9BACT|nr:MAG: hypothetical protein A3B18_04125 [Candidatus Giovannonibacteria bacterium RIFCSPLOWO2_01_FULL_46_13]